MLRLSIVALLILAVAGPASANWTRAQRAGFLGQCVESCQTTLNLPDGRRGVCDRTCACVADQAETQVTPADMYALDEAAAAGGTTETMQKIRGFFPACAKKATRIP
jgi:hypothetical protein